MDDFDSLLASQNFRLLDPTPFQPPPQLPLQKPKVKHGNLREFTQFNAPTQSSSGRKRPPTVDSTQSITIDLTLDDSSEDEDFNKSIRSVSSVTPQSSRYNTEEICQEAKSVGEHFGYEYGLASVLQSSDEQFYTVCPQQKVNILTCVIGQCILGGTSYKLIDIFGKMTCVMMKSVRGIDVQNEDILVLINCPVSFNVKTRELLLKIESENIIWNTRVHHFPEVMSLSTMDFMRANNISIELNTESTTKSSRKPSTGMEKIQTVETVMFEQHTRDIETIKATAASSETALLRGATSSDLQLPTGVEPMSIDQDEEWDSLGEDDWEPLTEAQLKSEDDFDDEI